MKQLKKDKKSLWHRFLILLTDGKTSPLAIPLLAIVLSLVVTSLIFLVLGKNPFRAFAGFLMGSGFWPKANYANGQNQFTEILSFMGMMAPMLLAALGVIVALKAGLFNIGISGQMVAAAFAATVLVGYTDLSAYIARPLVVLVGAVVGALLGALVGYLKYKFNIHEVVSTIMFNYIISYVVGYFINTKYVDPISRTSRMIRPEARLTIIGVEMGGLKLTLPLGILLAVAAVFALRFLLDRTVPGFEMKAVGLNRQCAAYAGVRVGKNIVLAMLLSGMLAGMAGVCYYVGHFNTIIPKELPALGYDSIAVALLGSLDPIGAIFASILVTILQKGSVYMSSNVGVPKEIASATIGILLLFSACGAYMRRSAGRWREKLEDELRKKEAAAETTPEVNS